MDCGRVARWHSRQYPYMTAQEFVKLAYQSAFGSEHMRPDPEKVLNYLRTEAENTPRIGEALFIPIGGGLCRLNLAALSWSGLRLETVAGLFACAGKSGGEAALEAELQILSQLAGAGELCVSGEEMDDYLARYRNMGCPAVHHSEAFRAHYAPAYRIVSEFAGAALPLFQKIDALLLKKAYVRVAIDGMSASGKSTAGALLQAVYGANLFHMDDYFLPFEKKTPQRLAQPGENVDHERFYAEIACRGPEESFDYTPYHCHPGCYGEKVHVEPRRLTIVEGAYALHPQLRDGYDLKVFFQIDPALQSRRILARNGEQMHRRFMEEWIPMENRYEAAFQVRDLCEVVLDAGFVENYSARLLNTLP